MKPARSFPSLAPFALSLLVLAGARPAAPAPVVIDSPAEPADGRVVIEPTERWRVGGESEEEGEFFGVVRQATIDAAGNTYLLDQQLHEVRVFDAAGHYVTTFGRQGEGPGELSNPSDLVLLGDGRVGVLHGRPSRLTLFAPSGGMGEDLTIGEGEAFGFSLRAEVAGDRPVVQRSVTTMGDGTQTATQLLVGLDPATGQHAVTFVEKSETMDRLGSGGRIMISINANAIAEWTAGPDGRVYVVRDPEGYEIEVYAPDGSHERTLRRAYQRVPKPEDVYEGELDQRRKIAERFGGSFDASEVARDYPDIADLFVRPGGELWVLPSSGRLDDDPLALGVFDVFDAAGRFVRQVEVRVPFVRGEDEFSFEGADLIVFEDSLDALRGGGGGMMVISGSDPSEDDDEEIEPLEIVRYQMP